jgi:glycerophosphoryl diester phosphodiesterase
MQVIGHRGCADVYPENTVRAVTRAANFLDAVEVDVRRCGSGELVVFHDETVDRLTDASGRLADVAWAELQELDVLGSGEPIPRLETVLAAVPDGVELQVELKETDLAADVREAVRAADCEVSVSSFDEAAIRKIVDLGWDVSTGLLFESDPVEKLQTAVELGCDAVHPYYDVCLETDVVEAAHEAGLAVVAWKAARRRTEIHVLRSLGVDGVTADRWEIASGLA